MDALWPKIGEVRDDASPSAIFSVTMTQTMTDDIFCWRQSRPDGVTIGPWQCRRLLLLKHNIREELI